MKRLMKYWVYTTTGLAAGVATLGAAYLAVDIAPAVGAGLLAIPKQDALNVAYIAVFGLLTLAFVKCVGKPFDKLMDRMYPDDIQPKQVV